MKSGESYGVWTLTGEEELGQGGNSIVWRAQGASHEAVAIKFLTRFDRYDRFRDEVQFQNENSCRPGVLPLLGFHLPETPSKADRPWLVTPISLGVREFVEQSDNKLVTAVKTVHDLASTLADIHLEGAVHRDLKPENMFIHGGRAVIGDFGLVSYPGKDASTVSGERLGPIYYVAPELLGNQEGPHDCRPGDVYSLAKTLWVLASGQRFPLPGNILATESVCRLSSFVNNERAVLLDRLIDASTVVRPGMRPTCREFADELEAWLEAKEDANATIAITAPTSARLRQFAELADRGRRERELVENECKNVLTTLHDQLIEIGRQLAEAGGVESRSKRLPDGNTNHGLRYFPYSTNEGHSGAGNRCFEEYFTTVDGETIVANGSAVLERSSNTHGVLKGGLVIAANHRSTEFVFETEHSFQFGSAIQESSIRQFVNELLEHIPVLAKRIVEILNVENEQ